MATSIRDMAAAVTELAQLKEKHLREIEELAYRLGYEPGHEGALAGMRIIVARGNAAARFLGQIAPHEAAILTWLNEKRAIPIVPG